MKLRKILAAIFGWQECSFEEYADAYKLYGGSNCTNPILLKFLQQNTAERFIFYSIKSGNKVKAAIFLNSSNEFCLPGPHNKLVNTDEIIFPADSSLFLTVPFKSKRISPIHKKNIRNLLPSFLNKRQICLVRNDLSSKTKKNRRNELNRFLKSGGEVIPVHHYTPLKLCEIYNSLFEKRWGKKINLDCISSLEQFISANPHMIFGNVLEINNSPCAFDLIIKTESPGWVSFDIPNGGIDPAYNHLSVGSVLMWVNTQQAAELCAQKLKEMRFSLGKPTQSYKERWCKPQNLLRTL